MTQSILLRVKLNLIGVAASFAFFFGSMLFLPAFANYATAGVWLFMTGSLLMFIDIVRPR